MKKTVKKKSKPKSISKKTIKKGKTKVVGKKKKVIPKNSAQIEKQQDVHYGGYVFHGTGEWGDIVRKNYISKIEKLDLVKNSDTSVFNRPAKHGRAPQAPKFTAFGIPSEWIFGSAIYVVELYKAHMIQEILKELFTGQTGKVLKNFVAKKAFKNIKRPIRYEYKILIPASNATVSIYVQGADAAEFQKSLAKITEMEKLALAWCGANQPSGGYVTFQIKDGVVTNTPFITLKPLK